MTDPDLQQARDRVRRLEYVRRSRASLAAQVADVERELRRLHRTCAEEEWDVDRLERRTLTSIVAGVLGNRAERLDKERAEAESARMRVAGHEARLDRLIADLDFLEAELPALADAPRHYQEALHRAEVALRRADDPRADDLNAIVIRIADLAADLRERDEARAAGHAALAAVVAVLKPLGSARGWSTADMFTGSFADLIEHGKLADAHDAAWHAQRKLDRFARELADIGMRVRLQMPPVDTSWFVDFFFDNIITDALKHQRIARSWDETDRLARWIQHTLRKLDHERADLVAEGARLAAERERLHGVS